MYVFIYLITSKHFKYNLKISACAKTHVSNERSHGSRLAKSEKTQMTYVNEYFSDKHNSLSRKSGKKLGFSRRNISKNLFIKNPEKLQLCIRETFEQKKILSVTVLN